MTLRLKYILHCELCAEKLKEGGREDGRGKEEGRKDKGQEVVPDDKNYT